MAHLMGRRGLEVMAVEAVAEDEHVAAPRQYEHKEPQRRPPHRLLREPEDALARVEEVARHFLNACKRILGLAQQSVRGTALRLFVLILPWGGYVLILRNCFYCHDFEAATAHQVGHLLGLGHPDVPPLSTLAPSHADGTPGNNSYNAFLASGGVVNATAHCTHVWDDVRAGTPLLSHFENALDCLPASSKETTHTWSTTLPLASRQTT